MTSPHPPDEDGYYSELQVLESAAGFYVGTLFHYKSNGFVGPGSRDSDYFTRKDEAEGYLRFLNSLDDTGHDADAGDVSVEDDGAEFGL